MILIAQKSLPRHFKLEGQKNFLSLLPQLWQELEGIPYSLKNGENWLLSEEIIRYPSSNYSFDKLKLYLLSEHITRHSKKYIINLSLEITSNTKLLAQIDLSLLSEDSWNEIIQKNQ